MLLSNVTSKVSLGSSVKSTAVPPIKLNLKPIT